MSEILDPKDIQHRMFPNTALNDRWVLTFSNIPSMSNMQDMRYFDNYIKTFTIPAYSIGMINTNGPMGFTVRHPLGGVKANQDLQELVVEFKISEDYLNYITIMMWIMQLRYGETNQKPTELFRDYVCKAAVLQLLDSTKRPVAHLKFTNLMPSSLSAVNLVMGSADTMSFSVGFTYEEIQYELKDTLTGAANPTAPEVISPCGVTGTSLTPTGTFQ